MTVFNRSRFLKAAINSVVAQTFQDWELIIWDDGSTDSSVKIANEYATCDKRIKFFQSEHTGRVNSLLSAISRSRGEYLGIIDSDDKIGANTLKETASVLDGCPNVGMVYTDYLIISPVGEILGLGHRCKIPYSPVRLLTDFMTFHFRLMRRSVYEKVNGFDPAFETIEDYDLCLKVSEVTEIYHLDRPYYYYREHSDQISKKENIKQIYLSQIAINNALKRRGIDRDFELQVSCNPSFLLKMR